MVNNWSITNNLSLMGPPEQEGKRLYLIYISMTELELQQYLLREYPQENTRCEWKEFKNLKNSFCGDEKNDVISYVSAIANMEGGDLVIGVHDKTLEIVGTDKWRLFSRFSVPAE